MFNNRYAKNEWTQLQITFMQVPISELFPTGCKVTFRKYTQNKVLLIEQCDESEGNCGFKVLQAIVSSQPEQTATAPEGMFVLRSLPPPGIDLQPDAFISGSREQLMKVVDQVSRLFSRHLPEVVSEWINFRDNIAPQDDSSENYVAAKGMYIPLRDQLFGVGQRNEEAVVLANNAAGIQRETVRFTSSVQWSGRGGGHEQISNVPYVAVGGPAIEPPSSNNRRRRRSPSVDSASTDSASEAPLYDYIELGQSNGPERDYFKYVGRKFKDDEDGELYMVVAVCDMRKVGARRSSNIVYAFKYVAIDSDDNDFQYTPAREMLNSYWCKWVEEEGRTTGRRAQATSSSREDSEQRRKEGSEQRVTRASSSNNKRSCR